MDILDQVGPLRVEIELDAEDLGNVQWIKRYTKQSDTLIIKSALMNYRMLLEPAVRDKKIDSAKTANRYIKFSVSGRTRWHEKS